MSSVWIHASKPRTRKCSVTGSLIPSNSVVPAASSESRAYGVASRSAACADQAATVSSGVRPYSCAITSAVRRSQAAPHSASSSIRAPGTLAPTPSRSAKCSSAARRWARVACTSQSCTTGVDHRPANSGNNAPSAATAAA